MTMLSGLEAQSEMNGLLDELYGDETVRARPGEAREDRRRANRGGAVHLGGDQDRVRVEGCQPPSIVEVVTRQEGGKERKRVTLLASNHEGEKPTPVQERRADEPKKERGLVDKVVDKAREKGFIDKANEAVDKIKARLTRR